MDKFGSAAVHGLTVRDYPSTGDFLADRKQRKADRKQQKIGFLISTCRDDRFAATREIATGSLTLARDRHHGP